MHEFKTIAIADLELDSDNPRLPSRIKGTSKDEVLEYLAKKTNVEDLIASIGKNNFFPGEAIVITQSEDSEDKYTVLEGNRRLTALRLLNNETLAEKISPNVYSAVKAARNKPDKVQAYEVGAREDVLQYLGFRHVSGVQRWDPLAKAKYLEMLYRESDGDPETKYREIASEIGSRKDTVRKNLDALAVYKIVEESKFFDIPDLTEESFKFGTFYTMTSNVQIAKFIGSIGDNNALTHPIEAPSSLKHIEIEELTRWTFEKDADKKTRLGESRNIPMLAAVVAAPKALDRFRNGEALEKAHRETPDAQNEFVQNINAAKSYIKSANENLRYVNGKAPEILESIRGIRLELHKMTEELGITEQAEPRQESKANGDSG